MNIGESLQTTFLIHPTSMKQGEGGGGNNKDGADCSASGAVPQISSQLNEWHICSLSTWIFLYIINTLPRRGSCLQRVSKASADTALPPLLTKRLSHRASPSHTECREHMALDRILSYGRKVSVATKCLRQSLFFSLPYYPPFKNI